MAAQDATAEATLHEDTLSELGLTEQPFQEDKKRQRFADSTTQKSRAALEQHLRFGDSLHLLIGETGAGKTVLLSQLIKHCKGSIKPFVVKGTPEFEAEAFLAAVLYQLDKEDQAESVEEHIEKLTPLFERVTEEQYSPVLVVDDAHLAPFEEIAELVDIIQQFESSDGKTARLLLTGTPALKTSITKIEDQFEDLDLKYSTNILPPLDEPRVREYLTSRLHQAGHADVFPFTDKAIAKIQRDSQGLPGKINANATHYLNGVYRGGAAAESKGGLIAGLEWPVLAVGAVALGAIAWGLSMFMGDNSDTTPVADVITIEEPLEPVVETTSITAPVESTLVTPTIENEPVVVVTEPATPSVDTDLVLSEPVAEVVQTPAIETTIAPVESPLESPVESPVESQVEPVAEITQENTQVENPLVIESAPEPVAEITVPIPSTNDTTAITKSVANSIPESVQVDVEQFDQTDNTAGTPVVVELPESNTDTDAFVDNLGEDLNVPSIVNSATTNAEAEGVIVADTNRAIENERWVLFQSPTKFTVQLATSKERGYIIDLAQTLEVLDPVAIYPFLTTNSKNPVYGLLSGLYDTRSEAIAAVDSMSDNAKQFGVWIRPVSDLQAAIKSNR